MAAGAGDGGRAQHEQGQKGPALTPRVKVAKPRPPEQGQGQEHESRLKNRYPGFERRPHEVGRDQSEGEQTGTSGVRTTS